MAEYSIGDALKAFLDKSRLKGDMQAMEIDAVWEQIMGKTIARYTDKLQIMGGSLYIYTSVAPLKNELLYQRDKIIERVNESLGSRVIKEIIIK